MAHSFANLLCHVIFSTKDRQPFLDVELRGRLFPYMGGILREVECIGLSINGPSDHVHLLIKMPATKALADVLRVLKTNSSKWVHDNWPNGKDFAWQAGYGAFSVSQSNADEVKRYIADQEEHHKRFTFQQEFVAFLKRHGIEYSERYIWE
jgi:REP element-mobilizing transposase RayT